MCSLFFWFLIGQTVAGLPDMAPGTEVRIFSLDLLTAHAEATVEGGTLAFDRPLEPGKEIRVLILSPNAAERETVNALSQALYGMISPEGDDILLKFEELDTPLSLRAWLAEERGITLEMTR